MAASALEEEEFTYASLVNRWRRERSSAALTRMDGHFYEAFDQHLRSLREDYQREHAVNPATPKVLILQDELMNLQRVRDDIYDLREKKIATAAIIAARGGNPDRGHMTNEEEVLFDEVLRVLRDARRNLLRRGQGPKDVPPPVKPAGGPPSPPDAVAPPALVATPAANIAERAPGEAGPEAPLPGKPEAPARSAPPAQAEAVAAGEETEAPRRMGPQRVLVRMRQDVEPFMGPDLREYRLSAHDVAALPREVAHTLIQRQMAVPVAG